MNNNIQESYITFEVGKLLKEVGFAVPTREYYRNYPTASIMSWDIGKFVNGNDDDKMKTAGGMIYISCPTTSLAIKWVRENFRISISSNISTSGKGMYEIWKIREKAEQGWERIKSEYGFDTLEEAENEAILYTLKNLTNGTQQS